MLLSLRPLQMLHVMNVS